MNLYAWTTNDSSMNVQTFYTLSATPSPGDRIYDATGTPYEDYTIYGDDIACQSFVQSYDSVNDTVTITLNSPL